LSISLIFTSIQMS